MGGEENGQGRELMYRICLGILKTDQWKPNSKMNQGKSIPPLNHHTVS
jgi:hypothetical protein